MSGANKVLAFIAAAVGVGMVVVALPGSARSLDLLASWIRTTGPGLGWALALFLSLYGLGRPIRARIAPDLFADDPLSASLLGLLLGMALWVGVLSFAAVFFRLPPHLGWLLCGAGAMSWWWSRSPARPQLENEEPPSGGWPLAPAPLLPVGRVLGGMLLLPWVVGIGAPPVGPDELQYHVRLTEALVGRSAAIAHPSDPVSAYFSGLHVLLAPALDLGGVYALRPFTACLTLAGAIIGERVAVRLGGAWAGALFWPLVAGAASFSRMGVQVGADTAQSLALGLGALLLTQGGSPARRLVLLGLLGGVAFSIKLAAPLFFAPLWLVVLPSVLRPRSWKLVAAWVGSALIPLGFALPWLARNLRDCGHALFPLFGFDAPADLAGAIPFDYTRQYGAGPGIRALLRTPWDLFVLGREFDTRHHLGRLNAWPLVLLPATLAAAWAWPRARKPLALVAVLSLGWALTLRRVAYLLTAWPLIAALAAVGAAYLLTAIRPSRLAAAIALGILTITGVSEVASPAADTLDAIPVALGRERREDFLERTVAGWSVGRTLEAQARPGDSVLLWGAWPRWGLRQELYWAGSEHLVALRIELLRAGSVDGVSREAARLGARWILHQRFHFRPESYPELDETTIQRTFVRPLALADRFLAERAVLRAESGGIELWEILPPP